MLRLAGYLFACCAALFLAVLVPLRPVTIAPPIAAASCCEMPREAGCADMSASPSPCVACGACLAVMNCVPPPAAESSVHPRMLVARIAWEHDFGRMRTERPPLPPPRLPAVGPLFVSEILNSKIKDNIS